MENEDDCLGLRLFKAGLRQSISRSFASSVLDCGISILELEEGLQ